MVCASRSCINLPAACVMSGRRWSFSCAALALGFVCCSCACIPACLCVSLKEKMWLEVHEFQSSYIAIVCVEICIVSLVTRSELRGKETHALMHHTHIHMHLCQMYTCTHLHAGTSCSLHRATMWRVQSPFPSRATALSSLK